MRQSRMAITGAIGVLAVVACNSSSLADSLDARLLGAWTTSQADCSKLFVRKGGALSYRQPVDKFAQAEISFVAARATKHSPLNLPPIWPRVPWGAFE